MVHSTILEVSALSAFALLEFIQLPTYTRSASRVLTEVEQHEIEVMLCRNPLAGQVIRGTGGIRKLRVAGSGRGKSRGYRLIYFLRTEKGRVYLMLLYSKSTQTDLTPGQRQEMRRLAAALGAER